MVSIKLKDADGDVLELRLGEDNKLVYLDSAAGITLSLDILDDITNAFELLTTQER